MVQRIREFYNDANSPFFGEVEVDQAHFGGLEINKHQHKKLNVGGGTAGKTTVTGMKNRDTNLIKAQVIESEDQTNASQIRRERTQRPTRPSTQTKPGRSQGCPERTRQFGHGVGQNMCERMASTRMA